MAVNILLKQIRESQGLSQNDLARLIDMSPQNIQKIEQGLSKSITYDMLGRLCKNLRCQPGDLLEYVAHVVLVDRIPPYRDHRASYSF